MPITTYANVGVTAIIPASDNGNDQGSPSLQWRTGYFGTSIVLASGALVTWGPTAHVVTNEGDTALLVRARSSATTSLLLFRPTSHATQVTTVGSPITKQEMRDADGANYTILAWGIDYGGAAAVEGDAWLAAGPFGTAAPRDFIINAGDAVNNCLQFRAKHPRSTVTRMSGMVLADGRNTTDQVTAVLIQASDDHHTAPSFASAATSYYRAFGTAAYTLTLTGGVTVTALDGLMAYVARPTVTSAVATTITDAATVTLAGEPVAAGAGPASFTRAYALRILRGNVELGNTYKLLWRKADNTGAPVGMYSDASDQLRVVTNSVDRWVWDATGQYIPLTTNVMDVGASGFTVRDIWVGTRLRLASIAAPASPAEGHIYHDSTVRHPLFYGANAQWEFPNRQAVYAAAADESPTLNASHNVVLLNGSTGGVSAFLPAITASLKGKVYTVKRVGGAVGHTVVPAGADTIDGAANYSLSALNKYVTVICNGVSDWKIIANN